MIEQLCDPLCERIDFVEMNRRHIQRERQQRKSFFPAVSEPLESGIVHIIVERLNLPGLLQNRQKAVREPERAVLAQPAYQHLGACNFLRFSADFRLEINLKFFFRKGILEGMNGLRALLFRAGKLGVVFEDAGGSFLRTPSRNVGMRDDFFRWCVRVIQIIDASVQRHVIQRVRFQHFADRLLVIGGNLFPHHGRILPGDIDNADKDIGVIAVHKERLRKELQFFQDEIQNVRTRLITPVIVDQVKIVDIRHQKGVLLFFASVIEKRKNFFF